MNEAARDAVLQQHCRDLNLPGVYREHQHLARQANEEGWPYPDYLSNLLEMEVASRHDRRAQRLVREARFPDIKTLDQVDWQALKGVSRPKILELASCDYLDRGQDVILAGPIGTGKTMLAIALGVEAAGVATGWPSAGPPTWFGSCSKPGMSAPSGTSTVATRRWRSWWWMNWASSPSTGLAENYCSTCWRSGTNGAPPS